MSVDQRDCMGVRIREVEGLQPTTITRVLYGDGLIRTGVGEWRTPTRWQRLRSRIIRLRGRVGDAWLVLTGQAWIDE